MTFTHVLNTTMNRYLAKAYTVNMLLLLGALLSVIYLFDVIELLRRASNVPDLSLLMIFQMALLKLPEIAQILFPFAILFSAMFTFWQLTRRYELIVARASGFSVWQFLTPIICVAVVVGLFQMTILNPIGAALVSRYDLLERRYLKREENQIAIFKEGLWLRQSINNGGYGILHASKITQPGWTLHNVMFLVFDDQDRFTARLQAKSAYLRQGRWELIDVKLFNANQKPTSHAMYALPTLLTAADVEESFSSPAALSFWRLPSHIKTLEDTGFDASRLKVHYHTLLAQPLMFMAMILLAATVSMRPPRHRGAFMLILGGVMIGFITFFLSSFLQALGASQQIPVLLAAWSPALIATLLGLSTLMAMEDG